MYVSSKGGIGLLCIIVICICGIPRLVNTLLFDLLYLRFRVVRTANKTH